MYSVRAAAKNSGLQLTVSLTVYWLYCGPHTVVMGAFATCRELGCLVSVWTMLQILGTNAELLCAPLLLLLMAAEEE